MEKKTWQKPQLIVLVRGKPEEAILSFCKGSMEMGYPGNVFDWCVHDNCLGCDFWAVT